MNESLNKILKNHISLFGKNPKLEKIDVGFTNTLYCVNNKYIIKICTDFSNERKFQKEIEFYESNENNKLIPKLYFSNDEKKEIPYLYEIIEKIDGISLYNVWHKLQEKEREEIIKKLCVAMKDFHSNIGKPYDWIEKTKSLFTPLYERAKSLKLFDSEEQELLDNAYLKFDQYLNSNEFVLVHNDLHFDNIFYNNGDIKLIDFERSVYAPKDFELDIIYRMTRKPWKYASEENEKYTKIEDYSNIMVYIGKYYPELMNIKYLYKRLAIYDIIYNLKHYINNPGINELKIDILTSAKEVTK